MAEISYHYCIRCNEEWALEDEGICSTCRPNLNLELSIAQLSIAVEAIENTEEYLLMNNEYQKMITALVRRLNILLKEKG